MNELTDSFVELKSGNFYFISTREFWVQVEVVMF